MNLIKGLFIFINFLVLGLGISLVVIGILNAKETEVKTDVAQIFGGYPVIISSVALAIFALFGMFGAFNEVTYLLCVYALSPLMLMIILIKMVAVSLHFEYNEMSKPNFINSLYTVMEKNIYELNKQEAKLKCCGVNGIIDYKGEIPKSCRDPDSGKIYEQGCGDIIYKYFSKMIEIICILCLVIMAVLMIAVGMALHITSQIRCKRRQENEILIPYSKMNQLPGYPIK